MNIITLNNGTLSLQCRLQGAVLLSLTAAGIDILRPADHPLAPPGECAMFPMLPMANRVEGNAFPWVGQTRALPPSPYDEQFFLHGDGWLLPWALIDRQPDSVTMALISALADVYRYRAELRYQLRDSSLLATLNVTNIADEAFPYGVGFHPFFMKSPSALLCFEAEGYWPERQHHLPGPWQRGRPAEWDFSRFRAPGNHWINNAFSGWRGIAALRDERAGGTVTLRSAADILMVFQPDNSDYLCLEPQTHPVNAHHLPGLPGLAVLQPQQALNFAMEINWSTLS